MLRSCCRYVSFVYLLYLLKKVSLVTIQKKKWVRSQFVCLLFFSQGLEGMEQRHDTELLVVAGAAHLPRVHDMK